MLDGWLRAGRAPDVPVCGGEGGLSRGAGSLQLRGPLRTPISLNVSCHVRGSRMREWANLCYGQTPSHKANGTHGVMNASDI